MKKRGIPPLYFLLALGSMAALDWLYPIQALLPSPYSWLAGGICLVAGLWIMGWAVRLFGKAETSIKPFDQSTALVLKGPYRFTRNPMYLGMALVLIGVGLMLGSASPLLVIPLFAGLIELLFIRPEEKRLTKTFATEYETYLARVRRWI